MSAPWRALLPTSLKIGGTDYQIRYDYRAVLDICTALSAPDLDQQDKALAAMLILYPDFEDIPPEYYREAIERCFWFINGGAEVAEEKKGPRLMDWEQDFPYIVGPVNRILGQEIRAIPYDDAKNEGGLHWFTFLAAFNEIGGNSTFAQIVRIRNMKARGRKLDKADQEWYRHNRHLVDFKTTYTGEEQATLKQWGL